MRVKLFTLSPEVQFALVKTTETRRVRVKQAPRNTPPEIFQIPAIQMLIWTDYVVGGATLEFANQTAYENLDARDHIFDNTNENDLIKMFNNIVAEKRYDIQPLPLKILNDGNTDQRAER